MINMLQNKKSSGAALTVSQPNVSFAPSLKATHFLTGGVASVHA